MSSRRQFLKVAGVGAAAAVVGGVAEQSQAAPNGTTPTQLTGLAVTAVNSTQMRVSGRYVTIGGSGIAGMPVKVYAVGTNYFTLWATIYTNNTGNFTVTTSKTPAGTRVQIEAEGNGAYSRPYPTFNRP